jgi:hypothetical protein
MESVNERQIFLDPICVKKRLENYDQMLQYYTLMRTKNKMKEFDTKSEDW